MSKFHSMENNLQFAQKERHRSKQKTDVIAQSDDIRLVKLINTTDDIPQRDVIRK